MHFDQLYHTCRQTLSRVPWRRIINNLRMRPDRCRECDHEVRFGDTICAFCGARDPVYVPRWVYTVIVGFGVVGMVSLFGRILGA